MTLRDPGLGMKHGIRPLFSSLGPSMCANMVKVGSLNTACFKLMLF
jgi:hypothetical protein